MELCILSLITVLGVAAAQPGDNMCPKPWHHYHSEYLNAERGANVAQADGSYAYQLQMGGAEAAGYLAEQTHAVALNVNGHHHHIKSFVVTALPEDGNSVCGGGSFLVSGPETEVRDDCPQVLRAGKMAHTKTVNIRWTAPRCGCVSMRATIVTTEGTYFTDDDDALDGPLTKTFCPSGHNWDSLETNVVEIADILDEEYYGIETVDVDGDDVDYEVDPEFGIPIDDGDEEDGMDIGIDDVDIADLIEEGEDEDGEDIDEEEMKQHPKAWKQNKKAWKKFFRKAKQIMKEKLGEEANKKVLKKKSKFMAKKLYYKAKKMANAFATKKGRVSFQQKWQKMNETARVNHVCHKILRNKITPRRQAWLKKAKNNPRRARMVEEFEGRREALEPCCKIDMPDARQQCLVEAKEDRFDRICQNEEHFLPPRKMRPAVQRHLMEKCCVDTGAGRSECFNKAITNHREARFSKKKGQMPAAAARDPVAQIANICERLSGSKRTSPGFPHLKKLAEEERESLENVWHSRRSALTECCEMHSEEDRLACVDEMREERWDRVCDETEPLYWRKAVKGRPQPPFITQCCEMQDDERYNCFEENKGQPKARNVPPRKWKKSHKKKHMHVHGPAEVEAKNQKKVCCFQGKLASRRVEEDAQDACSSEADRYLMTHEGGDGSGCRDSFERCCVHYLRKKSIKKDKRMEGKESKQDRKMKRRQRKLGKQEKDM